MSDDLLDNYNPLYDVHLRQYFALPHMQRHLRNIGLLNDEQSGSSDTTEPYMRHHSLIDRMLKNREVELQKYADLQKKLEAAEKIEICRRIRSGVTNGDTYHRAKPSRSLSRGRLMARRQRRSSTSTEEKDLIKKIETENEEPQWENPKLVFNRLSTKILKYRYLHKLDDETLAAYMEQLRRQLRRLERFCEISFGPYSVARHQSDPHVSWFFRRRSLPSLNGANTLHESPQRNSQKKRRSRSGKSSSPKFSDSTDSRSLQPLKKRRRSSSNNIHKLPPITRTSKIVPSTTVPSTVAKLPPPESEKTALSKKITQKTVIKKKIEPVRVQKVKQQNDEGGLPQLAVVGIPATLNNRKDKQATIPNPTEIINAPLVTNEPISSPDSLTEYKSDVTVQETVMKSPVEETFESLDTDFDTESRASISGSTVSVQEEHKLHLPSEETRTEEVEQFDKVDAVGLEADKFQEPFAESASQVAAPLAESILESTESLPTNGKIADIAQKEVESLRNVGETASAAPFLQQELAESLLNELEANSAEAVVHEETVRKPDVDDIASGMLEKRSDEIISHKPADMADTTEVVMCIGTEEKREEESPVGEAALHDIELVKSEAKEGFNAQEKSLSPHELQKVAQIFEDVRSADAAAKELHQDLPQSGIEVAGQTLPDAKVIDETKKMNLPETLEPPHSANQRPDVMELHGMPEDVKILERSFANTSEPNNQKGDKPLSATEPKSFLIQSNQDEQYHEKVSVDTESQLDAPTLQSEAQEQEPILEVEKVTDLKMEAERTEVRGTTSANIPEAPFDETYATVKHPEEKREQERLVLPPSNIGVHDGEQKNIITAISTSPEDEMINRIRTEQGTEDTGYFETEPKSLITSEDDNHQQHEKIFKSEQISPLESIKTAVESIITSEKQLTEETKTVSEHQVEPRSELEEEKELTMNTTSMSEQLQNEPEKHLLQTDVPATDLGTETTAKHIHGEHHLSDEKGTSAINEHLEAQQHLVNAPLIVSGTEEQSETEAEMTSRTVDEEIRKVFAQMPTDSEDLSKMTSPPSIEALRDSRTNSLADSGHAGIAWEIPAFDGDEAQKSTIPESVHSVLTEEIMIPREHHADYEATVQGISSAKGYDTSIVDAEQQILYRTPEVESGARSPTAMDANIETIAPADNEYKSKVADKDASALMPQSGEAKIEGLKDSDHEKFSKSIESESESVTVENEQLEKKTPSTPPPSADLEIFRTLADGDSIDTRITEKLLELRDDDSFKKASTSSEGVTETTLTNQTLNEINAQDVLGSDSIGSKEKSKRNAAVIPPTICIDYATENFLTSEVTESIAENNEDEIKKFDEKPKQMVIADDSVHEEMYKKLDNFTEEATDELRAHVDLENDGQEVTKFVEDYVNDIVQGAVVRSKTSPRTVEELTAEILASDVPVSPTVTNSVSEPVSTKGGSMMLQGVTDSEFNLAMSNLGTDNVAPTFNADIVHGKDEHSTELSTGTDVPDSEATAPSEDSANSGVTQRTISPVVSATKESPPNSTADVPLSISDQTSALSTVNFKGRIILKDTELSTVKDIGREESEQHPVTTTETISETKQFDNNETDDKEDRVIIYPQISDISADGLTVISGLCCTDFSERMITDVDDHDDDDDNGVSKIAKGMISDKNGNIEMLSVKDNDNDDDLSVSHENTATTAVNNGTEKLMEKELNSMIGEADNVDK